MKQKAKICINLNFKRKEPSLNRPRIIQNMNILNSQDAFYTAAYKGSEVCTALNGIFDLGLDKKYYLPKERNK